MAQSAWNTQFFDGRVFPKKPGHSAEIAAGATPPAMYTQPAALTDRGRMLGLASITLRTATLLFSIVAITMMSLDKEVRRVSAFSFVSVKFTDLSAYIFLVSMNAIVCAYSMTQLLHTILLLMSGKAFPQPVVSLGVLTYTCDQVLSFSLMAASAAGAAAAVILRKGEIGLSCSSYNILQFCAKSEAAVATSFISFMFIAVCNSFSAYRLFQQLNVP
ncbi:unnamed protein product [Sphagnum jensenii]|uniref:CASP-like protein n=1 Tax=Sphagnum jensenii TaxID=128206 RepID=A0ABP1B900_9BRYO